MLTVLLLLSSMAADVPPREVAGVDAAEVEAEVAAEAEAAAAAARATATATDPVARDPATTHDGDDDRLVSRTQAQHHRARIERRDEAVRRALVVGLSAGGVGIVGGAGFAFLALISSGFPERVALGTAAALVFAGTPTAALLLLAPDSDPGTPWFAVAGTIFGGLVGLVVGVPLVTPLQSAVDNGNDFIGDGAEGPMNLVPVATAAVGSLLGISIVALGAGRHLDVE